jgi:tyrosinase
MKFMPLLLLPLAAQAWIPASTEGSDLLAAQSLANLREATLNGSLEEHLAVLGVPQTCQIEEAVVRKEYSTLSSEEKLNYTAAVRCLMDNPATVPSELAPGAKSRYDDFVAAHINQTDFIHSNGPFLFWHRLYIWAFETALREECGYTGYLPYWNYGKSAEDLRNSP